MIHYVFWPSEIAEPNLMAYYMSIREKIMGETVYADKCI